MQADTYRISQRQQQPYVPVPPRVGQRQQQHHQYIGASPQWSGGTEQGWSVWMWLFIIVVALLSVLGLAGFIWIAVNDAKNIKSINGVGPTNGNVGAVEGAGVSITEDPATSTLTWALALVAGKGIDLTGTESITVSNTGVVTNIAGNGIAVSTVDCESTISNTGIVTLVADDGIQITRVGTEATIKNTGVLSVVAGTALNVSTAAGIATVTNDGVHTLETPAESGLTVNAGTGPEKGTIVAQHELTRRTLALSDADPAGPHVQYQVDIGYFVTIPANTWRTTWMPGFVHNLAPGAIDNGAGEGDSLWEAPANGLFGIYADCELFPSSINVDDHQSVTVAMSLNAATEDPFITGYVPPGGWASMDLSAGGTNVPAVPLRLHLSSVFQVCPTCPVLVGDFLTFHARQDVSPGSATLDVSCRVQIAQLI